MNRFHHLTIDRAGFYQTDRCGNFKGIVVMNLEENHYALASLARLTSD
jgi:hypothetical protein